MTKTNRDVVVEEKGREVVQSVAFVLQCEGMSDKDTEISQKGNDAVEK